MDKLLHWTIGGLLGGIPTLAATLLFSFIVWLFFPFQFMVAFKVCCVISIIVFFIGFIGEMVSGDESIL